MAGRENENDVSDQQSVIVVTWGGGHVKHYKLFLNVGRRSDENFTSN